MDNYDENDRWDAEEDFNDPIEAWDKLFFKYFPFNIEVRQLELDDNNLEDIEIIRNLESLFSLEELSTEVAPIYGSNKKQRFTKSVIFSLIKARYPSVAAGVYIAFRTRDLRLLCIVLLLLLVFISRLLKGSSPTI